MVSKMEEEEAAKLPKHESWMTMMPEVKALGFNLDDAQKNRTFQRREKTERGDTSAWTDTPADKARREREKELGLTGTKRKADDGEAVAAREALNATAATRRMVEQYNSTVRSKSLVEIHREEQRKAALKGGKKSGEVALGQWDRSEVSQTRIKDEKSVNKILQEATGMGGLQGRFGSSSFHGF